jgi:hypothetical protein
LEPLPPRSGHLSVVKRFIVTLSVVIAACGCTSAEDGVPSTAVGLPSSPPPSAPVDHRGGHPNCGFIRLTSPGYGSHLHVTSGKSGDTVLVTGTTLRGEDGRFTPARRLEVWWNTRVPLTEEEGAPPIVEDSPILMLAIVRDMDTCRFRTEFSVPDVLPGRYQVKTFVFTRDEEGLFGWQKFTVK